jgi:hypothetical protein
VMDYIQVLEKLNYLLPKTVTLQVHISYLMVRRLSPLLSIGRTVIAAMEMCPKISDGGDRCLSLSRNKIKPVASVASRPFL